MYRLTSKKLSKSIKYGIFFALFVLFAFPIYAQNYLAVELNGNGELKSINVIKDNSFYIKNVQSYEPDIYDPDDTSKYLLLYLYNETNEVDNLSDGKLIEKNKVNYYPIVKLPRMIKLRAKLYPLSFCNNNDVCEPCRDGLCELNENSLVCNDCATGGKDNFCDIKNDRTCDNDCINQEPDCGCVDCSYDVTPDNRNVILCERDYGGEICDENEKCNGRFQSTFDSGLCCLSECINLVEEKKEMKKETIFNPLMSIYIGFSIGLLVLLFIIGLITARKHFNKTAYSELQEKVNKLVNLGYTKPQIRDLLIKEYTADQVDMALLYYTPDRYNSSKSYQSKTNGREK